MMEEEYEEQKLLLSFCFLRLFLFFLNSEEKKNHVKITKTIIGSLVNIDNVLT